MATTMYSSGSRTLPRPLVRYMAKVIHARSNSGTATRADRTCIRGPNTSPMQTRITPLTARKPK